jgi:hypothetical protein
VLLTALVVWLGCTALGIDLAEVTP